MEVGRSAISWNLGRSAISWRCFVYARDLGVTKETRRPEGGGKGEGGGERGRGLLSAAAAGKHMEWTCVCCKVANFAWILDVGVALCVAQQSPHTCMQHVRALRVVVLGWGVSDLGKV